MENKKNDMLIIPAFLIFLGFIANFVIPILGIIAINNNITIIIIISIIYSIFYTLNSLFRGEILKLILIYVASFLANMFFTITSPLLTSFITLPLVDILYSITGIVVKLITGTNAGNKTTEEEETRKKLYTNNKILYYLLIVIITGIIIALGLIFIDKYKNMQAETDSLVTNNSSLINQKQRLEEDITELENELDKYTKQKKDNLIDSIINGTFEPEKPTSY